MGRMGRMGPMGLLLGRGFQLRNSGRGREGPLVASRRSGSQRVMIPRMRRSSPVREW